MAAAVGSRENPAYPFQAMVEGLAPVVEKLKEANRHNEPLDRDDTASALWLRVAELDQGAYPVWADMFEHYHEGEYVGWDNESPFGELTWAVADFCEDLERTRPHSREICGSEQGDRLITAYDAFVAALDSFYGFQSTPAGVRSRVSPLAARRLSVA